MNEPILRVKATTITVGMRMRRMSTFETVVGIVLLDDLPVRRFFFESGDTMTLVISEFIEILASDPTFRHQRA